MKSVLFLLGVIMWQLILPPEAICQSRIDSVLITMEDIEITKNVYYDDGHGNSSTSNSKESVNYEFISTIVKDSMSADTLILQGKNASWSSDRVVVVYDSVTNFVDSMYIYLGKQQYMDGIGTTRIRFQNVNLSDSSKTFELDLDSSGLVNSNFFYSYSASGKAGTGLAWGSTSETLTGRFLSTSRVSIKYFKHLPLSTVDLLADHRQMGIYPNPASNILTVQSKDINKMIEVFDALGREILIPEINRTHESISFNTSSLVPGIYWLRTGSQTQKIVIQR